MPVPAVAAGGAGHATVHVDVAPAAGRGLGSWYARDIGSPSAPGRGGREPPRRDPGDAPAGRDRQRRSRCTGRARADAQVTVFADGLVVGSATATAPRAAGGPRSRCPPGAPAHAWSRHVWCCRQRCRHPIEVDDTVGTTDFLTVTVSQGTSAAPTRGSPAPPTPSSSCRPADDGGDHAGRRQPARERRRGDRRQPPPMTRSGQHLEHHLRRRATPRGSVSTSSTTRRRCPTDLPLARSDAGRSRSLDGLPQRPPAGRWPRRSAPRRRP